MIYDLIAPVYDEINRDIDYSRWADFIEENIKREYKETEPASLVLDLGCGTGRMTIELAKRGYDMTGIDASPEMLNIARDESIKQGVENNILWLCQDMTEFELYGTVEIVVSCLDCINHIIDTKSLAECFRLVHNYLSPNGLFIFDVNGKGKFERIYADNSYVFETDKSLCIWQNNYNLKSKICDFYITLFSEDEDGKYDRADEMERERMYTVRSLINALKSASLMPIGVYRDFDFNSATDDDERIYFVARCVKGEFENGKNE